MPIPITYSTSVCPVPRLSGLDRQLAEVNELLSARRLEKAAVDIKYELAALRVQAAILRHAHVCRKAGFNPSQPRVPAGSREGGQWTDTGGRSPSRPRAGDNAGTGGDAAKPARPVDISNILGSGVMSDASPDPVIPGAQYAQTRVEIETSALTGISSIDDTTIRLANTLARVRDVINYVPDLGPTLYGTEVHTMFAAALRLQQLRGVEVEPTFGGPYYGAKGSLRPDAVLRNDAGDIVAIYDVKTGKRSIDPIRAARLRMIAGVGNNVPVIELSVPYGVRRKSEPIGDATNALFGRREYWRY